ncbi:MAG: hypothetical protein AB8B65_05635 [Kordia sp.]|uniref:hypothetical protein n=1 Tax=Kordia sp. TaxID=1965332 RepID=UPI00385CA807
MHTQYYKPSGKTNSKSFLYLLLAILIAAPILTVVYTYAVLYIPIVYLNVGCVIGIAFGLGFAANFVVGLGKVRNQLVAILFGLIIGIAGLYFSWIIWVYYHLNASPYIDITHLELLESPEALWDVIWKINEQGTWGIGRNANAYLSGRLLTTVWGIEAIAFIGTPIFFAFTKANDPYLEEDDNWADTTKIGPFEFIFDNEILKKQLEAKNYEPLLAMGPALNDQQKSHAIFTLYHNKKRTHGKEFYLSVSNMKERIDKKGQLNFDEKRIINSIRIPKDVGTQLIAKIGTSIEVQL